LYSTKNINTMSKKNKQVVEITKDELLTILLSVEKPKFTYLVTETNVRMNKTNNPYYDQIKKVTKGKFLIGGDYEIRVINEGKKQGLDTEFHSTENKVGKHLSKCVIFNEEKNQHYLMCEYFTKVPMKTEHYFEGNQIQKTLFENWLVKKSDTSRQPQERKVNVISYKLDNIKELSLNGNKYIVK